MPYVKRNSAGQIEAVSLEAGGDCAEFMAEDAEELAHFLNAVRPHTAAFDEADRSFVRVLEDLVDLLLERDVVRFTDFPEAAQKKLLARRSMRHSLNKLNLLDEDEDII